MIGEPYAGPPVAGPAVHPQGSPVPSTAPSGRHRRPGRHRSHSVTFTNLVNPFSVSVASLTAATFLVNAAFSPTAGAATGPLGDPVQSTIGGLADTPASPASATTLVSLNSDAEDLAQAKAEQLELRAAARAAAADRLAKARLQARMQAWVLPLSGGHFTSPFAQRWGRMHEGDDFGTPVGTPLRSLSSGTVVFAGVQGGYGNKVEVKFWDGTVAFYGHMSKVDVKAGQKLTPGQVVGLSGNTGHSTGPHLHLEIHPNGGDAIDPKPWLIARDIFPA
jgi:murein DD-endopeptidase MepM/ murein hydrolase activator NlpD